MTRCEAGEDRFYVEALGETRFIIDETFSHEPYLLGRVRPFWESADEPFDLPPWYDQVALLFREYVTSCLADAQRHLSGLQSPRDPCCSRSPSRRRQKSRCPKAGTLGNRQHAGAARARRRTAVLGAREPESPLRRRTSRRMGALGDAAGRGDRQPVHSAELGNRMSVTCRIHRAVSEKIIASLGTRFPAAKDQEMTEEKTARIADFDQLVRRHQKQAYNVAYRMTGNHTDAEDLTQEAFVRAFRFFGNYRRDWPFDNWLYKIMSNLFVDDLRRRPKAEMQSLDQPLETSDSGRNISGDTGQRHRTRSGWCSRMSWTRTSAGPE